MKQTPRLQDLPSLPSLTVCLGEGIESGDRRSPVRGEIPPVGQPMMQSTLIYAYCWYSMHEQQRRYSLF
jgi:hypothetical protein